MKVAKEEKVNFWMIPQLNNLELLHAPGEARDGSAVSNEGWIYRMFYLKPQLLELAAHEITSKAQKPPLFTAGVIKDDRWKLHFLLENQTIPLMEQESYLLAMLTEFISRHADERLNVRGVGKENRAVSLVREYIEDTYTQNISIKHLSNLCNLSHFHLIRVFKEFIGVPPHAYLKQVWIKRAKVLFAQGFSLSFIAHEIGFTDQSHFSKQFKQITGITPNKYSNIVQDLSSEKSKMK